MSEQEFIKSLDELNILVKEEYLTKLKKYYELLIETNKVMNLTTILEQNEVYLKHFYDSLTLTKVVNLNDYSTFCDIGTGAGFPGIVIKIFFPNLKVTLIESMGKRVEFLKKVIKELDLKDIEVINDRAENYALNNREKFDIVTARAVANINILLEYCVPIIKTKGLFIAMKGKEEEVSETAIKQLNIKLLNKEIFYLPNDFGQRTLYVFSKEKETLVKFPRKYNEIKKRPL